MSKFSITGCPRQLSYGIGTIHEAMDSLNADGLFEQIIREPLTAARDLRIDYANASEAEKPRTLLLARRC